LPRITVLVGSEEVLGRLRRSLRAPCDQASSGGGAGFGGVTAARHLSSQESSCDQCPLTFKRTFVGTTAMSAKGQ